MLLPGSHSGNDGEDGEQVPEWVSVFQQFWEHKIHHPSKSAKEEQWREERPTMQRTVCLRCNRWVDQHIMSLAKLKIPDLVTFRQIRWLLKGDHSSCGYYELYNYDNSKAYQYQMCFQW